MYSCDIQNTVPGTAMYPKIDDMISIISLLSRQFIREYILS